MKRHREILYVLTAIFLAFVVCLCVTQRNGEVLSFQISSDASDRSITLWESDAGQYYVFLPAYAQMECVRICLEQDCSARINGITLENGMACLSFETGVPYPFSYTVRGKCTEAEITFLRSGNVATMYMDTRSGDMDHIHKAKGNKETGQMALYLSDGTRVFSGELSWIQGRGNATWKSYEKKPYNIRLEDSADLLNLGNAQKWSLLANAGDPTHLRNKVIFDFAKEAGLTYVPDSDWVDLYLNGEYAGLYLLCESHEVHPQRVDLAPAGSFLVSLEYLPRLKSQNYPYVSTSADQHLRIHFPENLTDSQLVELEKTWQSLENAILAEDDLDPLTGKSWMDQIDLDSWAKKYLVEEIFGNYDGCFISQFFYRDGKDTHGKLYAGPVWDYDNTMGSELGWRMCPPNLFCANRYEVRDGSVTPWFWALCQKEIFYDRMVELYRDVFLPTLNNFLYGYMDDCTERIYPAAQMDQIRWDLSETNLEAQADHLQAFMRERTGFLNRIWLEELPYHTVRVDEGTGGYYRYYAVFSEEKFNNLPDFDNLENREFLGWYHSDTGEPFCSSDPICEDLQIQAKWKTQSKLTLGGGVRRILLLVWLILLLCCAGIDFYRRSLERNNQ